MQMAAVGGIAGDRTPWGFLGLGVEAHRFLLVPAPPGYFFFSRLSTTAR